MPITFTVISENHAVIESETPAPAPEAVAEEQTEAPEAQAEETTESAE